MGTTVRRRGGELSKTVGRRRIRVSRIVGRTHSGKTVNSNSFGRALGWIGLSIGPTLPLLASLSAPPPVHSQTGSATPTTQAPSTRARKTSTPYTGDLSIFDTPGRDERLQINRVMDMLGIEPGKNVADIGAGSGWFAVRAARRVSGSGTIYAVDISPEAIRYTGERAKKEQLQNVKTVLSKPDDPQLPSHSIDAVLLLKTYHEVAHPVVLLTNLRSSLKPGAKIGIIDRNGNGENHGVSKDVVVREAVQAGYVLRDSQDFVKADGMDYFLIFVAKAH
jgi:2-polyprenyl-3-methyl-5-hydroxy-6-metoxy-1,4-benzoquinol methylase